jgi:hypothetical protein
MTDLLASLLPDALAQPLCISDKVLEEARENLFYFGPAESELPSLTAPSVEAWLHAVLASKRRQLLAKRGHHYPMQFYCWHDAQASQLRFSLVSAAAALPFGCALRLVELSAVVQEFLAQEYLVFDVNLFNPDSDAARLASVQAAPEAFVLPVWRVLLP